MSLSNQNTTGPLTTATASRKITFMELNVITHPQTFELQSQIFKALTHPARLAILEILRDGEHCVCHMEAHLGYRQAYLSQQLAVLREAGIIQDRRDGWNIYYRVARPEVFQLLDTAAAMTGQVSGMPQAAAGADCPCPRCAAKNENS